MFQHCRICERNLIEIKYPFHQCNAVVLLISEWRFVTVTGIAVTVRCESYIFITGLYS